MEETFIDKLILMSQKLTRKQSITLQKIKKICEYKAQHALNPSEWYVNIDYDLDWRIRNVLTREGLNVVPIERKHLKHVYGCGCDIITGPDNRCVRYWNISWGEKLGIN